MNDITLVGVDTGGTFTDIVVLERSGSDDVMRHCKVLSNPSIGLADTDRPSIIIAFH